MKPRCSFLRQNGTQCKNAAVGGSPYCSYHRKHRLGPNSGEVLPDNAPLFDTAALARVIYVGLGGGSTSLVFLALQKWSEIDFVERFGRAPLVHFIFGIALPSLLFFTRHATQIQTVETLRQVHRSPVLHATQSKVYDVSYVDVGPQPYLMAGVAFVWAASYPIAIWIFVTKEIGLASFLYLSVVGVILGIRWLPGCTIARFSSASIGGIIAAACFWLIACIPKEPNKAPEPTSTSVTPRATLRFSEMKQRTEIRIEARVVPAVAVAHL